MKETRVKQTKTTTNKTKKQKPQQTGKFQIAQNSQRTTSTHQNMQKFNQNSTKNSF